MRCAQIQTMRLGIPGSIETEAALQQSALNENDAVDTANTEANSTSGIMAPTRRQALQHALDG